MASRFGPYRLLRRIAAGGMGEVYLAVLEKEGGFQKTVALKTMLPTVENSKSFAELFESEASVAAMLNHANIVQVFDHGFVEGRSYLTMELVEGPDLGSLMASAGPRGFPPGVASEIGVQLCRALGHAHERRDLQGSPAGIVHGDVSPANVLISGDGQVKLTDFGLARVRQVFSEDGSITGKYSYMSPEQACGKPLQPVSDLFSLGLVLYELFTGAKAFAPGDTPEQALVAVRNHQLKPAQEIYPQLPGPLADFLDRALSPTPADRFQTAREMSSALATACPPGGQDKLSEFIGPAAQRSGPTRAATPEPTELARKPVSPAAPSKNRTPWIALAILFVVGWGAGLSWWAFHTPEAQPPPAPRPSPPVRQEPGPPAEPAVSEEAPRPRQARQPPPVQTEPVLMTVDLPDDFLALVNHRQLAGNRLAIKRARPHLVRLKPKAGKAPEISLRLSPSGRPDGSWYAALRATPWMKIQLGKRPAGQTPRSQLVLPPGNTRLLLSRNDRKVVVDLEVRKAD